MSKPVTQLQSSKVTSRTSLGVPLPRSSATSSKTTTIQEQGLRTYVLDTSVLLSDPKAMFRFKEQSVVIPIVVINELEKKRHDPEIGYFARQALRALDAGDAARRRGQADRPARVRAERSIATARRHRRARAGRGSARGTIQRIGVLHQPADRAPPAHRVRRSDVRPFTQVRLAEDHRARRAQPRHRRCVAPGDIVLQRQAARRRRHPVGGFDIVLDQYRHAMQRPTRPAGRCLGIETRGISVFACVPQFFYLIHQRVTDEVAKRGPLARAVPGVRERRIERETVGHGGSSRRRRRRLSRRR